MVFAVVAVLVFLPAPAVAGIVTTELRPLSLDGSLLCRGLRRRGRDGCAGSRTASARARAFFGDSAQPFRPDIVQQEACALTCTACGEGNAAGAKYCASCGESLFAACEECGAAVPHDARFCSACGTPQHMERLALGNKTIRITPPDHLAQAIKRDRSKLEGERRVVSILFADAAGFAPASEQLEEEEVYGLMQGCFGCMTGAIHEFEGTIIQYTGDGLMAVFGAPIAHEDSARRAVLAGLALQNALEDYAQEVHKWHDIECRFRVGINTGPIIVHSIGDDLNMQYTSLGDSVSLASDAVAQAKSGSVYITDNTCRTVRDFFDVAKVESPSSIRGLHVPTPLRLRASARKANRLRRLRF